MVAKEELLPILPWIVHPWVDEPARQPVEAVFKEVVADWATTAAQPPKRPRLTELMDRDSPRPPPPPPMLTMLLQQDSKVKTEIGSNHHVLHRKTMSDNEHFFWWMNEWKLNALRTWSYEDFQLWYSLLIIQKQQLQQKRKKNSLHVTDKNDH